MYINDCTPVNARAHSDRNIALLANYYLVLK